MEMTHSTPFSLVNIIAFIVFCVICFGLEDKISWKWLASGIGITIVLILIFPLIHLSKYVLTVIIVSEVLSIFLIYNLLNKKIPKWLAYIIGIIGALVWAIILFNIAGIIYNI